MTLIDTGAGASTPPNRPEAVTPVIELREVGRTFPGPPPVEALKPSNLRIDPGEYVSIVGPSGSGKSTLLHLLGLLDRPTAGEFLLDGIDTGSLGDNARAGLRGSRIGFVFQSFHLLQHRTVRENVELAQVYNRMPRRDRRARAEAALERVGLSHRIDFTPRTLSGGERQRVAVARALVSEPSLLLADEPTGNLDTEMSAEIMDVFDALHRAGLTLAVITHDLDVSARAERRVRITDGRLRPA
ncbi:MAG: ABC transporter ATP-binding protein [Actinomycetota bacterium]